MSEIKEVFISYHEKSAGKLAADIANKLESVGISCWYTQRDLPPGESFANWIPLQIQDCKVFLLILNEGTNHSRHIENEVTLAFRRLNNAEDITLFPYRIEDCAMAPWLDYYLAQIQIKSSEYMDIGKLATQIAHTLGREPAKNGQCGFNAKWTLKDNMLTIFKIKSRYSSQIGDFYLQSIPAGINTPWWSEHKKITHVIIENGITNIGERAFWGCSNLSNVTIPDSVKEIAWSAFRGCPSLRSVSIPESAKIDTMSFDPHTQVIRRPPR